jgi:hypothetical protein
MGQAKAEPRIGETAVYSDGGGMSVFGSKLVVFLVLAAFSDALFSQTQTPTRRALLIGNANYRNLKPLATPI